MKPTEVAVFKLFKRAVALKELPRTGAIIEGVTRSEADTIAAHSWAVSLLSVVVATHLSKQFPGIDIGRVAIMAILHDLTECITGDLPSGLKRFAPEAVDMLEPRVSEFLLEGLLGKDDLTEVLNEYEARTTAAAKIVKFADIVDAWAHLQLRLKREFPSYLEHADKLLRMGSSEDLGVGSHLADWLQACREEWPTIQPSPLSKATNSMQPKAQIEV